MIRVCHIVNLITGQADGVYTHLKMIFENSDRTKFQHYLIFQGGEHIEKEISGMGVKVFVSTSLKKKISIRAFTDICRILKINNIDIIHTHLIKPYAIAGLVNIILKKKFIFNYHGIFLKNNPYYNFIERSTYSAIHYFIFLFGKVDSVLVPSKRNKELLAKETKLFPGPTVYYNGYYLSKVFFECRPDLLNRIHQLKENKIVIALVGRLEIDKRIDRAINLVRNLITKKQNIHLLIFGDGTLNNDLQNHIKKLDLTCYIDLLGYVKGVQTYYKFFDIVLFTSDWEGMPLTIWEAMANSVPIVAPDIGGFKEILKENNCGRTYEPGNLIEVEEQLIKLIDDEQLRKKMGENGRTAIQIKYNEKNFINQIEQIYLSLLSR